MSELCDCPPEAGNADYGLLAQNFKLPSRAMNACPKCGNPGRGVQGQTVKSILSVSLRHLQDVKYLFCRTQSCQVVYFSTDSEKVFTVEQVRERVFQKEPDAKDVLVCYCFHHTVGDLRTALSKERVAIIHDINMGINAGQCACDLRNPQGSCCLGNVRALIKTFERSAIATT